LPARSSSNGGGGCRLAATGGNTTAAEAAAAARCRLPRTPSGDQKLCTAVSSSRQLRMVVLVTHNLKNVQIFCQFEIMGLFSE